MPSDAWFVQVLVTCKCGHKFKATAFAFPTDPTVPIDWNLRVKLPPCPICTTMAQMEQEILTKREVSDDANV